MEYTDCPCCGEHLILCDYDANIKGDVELTSDNIKYPDYFDTDHRNAVEIDGEKITEWIKRGIDFLRKNPDQQCYFTSSGDTTVHIYSMCGDEEFLIDVGKNNDTAYIQFNDNDKRIFAEEIRKCKYKDEYERKYDSVKRNDYDSWSTYKS